jgi:hypothetical protein
LQPFNLVTSDFICRVAERFGARYFGDVLTGFKWIGSLIDEMGPKDFVLGFEEAHGYLAGTYARDKDGGVAAMLLAELAAECKQQHRTLHGQLDQLFLKYGCHLEKAVSLTMPGADGMARMLSIIGALLVILGAFCLSGQLLPGPAFGTTLLVGGIALLAWSRRRFWKAAHLESSQTSTTPDQESTPNP